MNNITQQCVSLANGTLSPDLRVDYQFGLVLGVNEFRQEQQYFLEKDYLHNRALHGYGTVSGLNVTIASTTDSPKDAQITVEPGIALDQWGRPVVIRDKQCARLGAWLAKREQQKPGEIAKHRGASDDLHLYVVVSYDECEDALVPIPGQPCSSGDALQAPSRIRDSFNIELRWEPPSMPAWDAVRCFARLMAHVRIVQDLPLNLSDEDTIIEHVRGLHLPCPDYLLGSPPLGSPPDQFLRLPAATARAALDRIFTVWVTEVRPKLIPNLIDPGTSEAGILLTRIDFTYDSNSKAITLLGAPPDYTDDEGRPFLLHTQLIQELLLQEETAKPEREFATLQVRNAHTLRAWVHHPETIALPSGTSVDWSQVLELKSDGIALSIQNVSQESNPQDKNVFDITINPFEHPQLMLPGARVELTFKIGALYIQSNSGGSLLSSIDALDFDYVGHDHSAGTIAAYTTMDKTPVQEFATFVTLPSTVAVGGETALILWFHTKEPINLPSQVEGFRVDPDTGAQTHLLFNTKFLGENPFAFFWELGLASTGSPPEPALPNFDILTLLFDTDAIHSGNTAKILTEAIKEQQLTFVGYNSDHSIELHHQIHDQTQTTTAKPEREFATLQVRDRQTLRAWVHHPEPVVIPQGTPLNQTLELKSDGTVFSIQNVSQESNPQDKNVFDITISSNFSIVQGALVELTFKIGALHTQSGGLLQSSIDALDFDYAGYDRAANVITVYTIVPQQQPTISIDDVLKLPTQPLVTITPGAQIQQSPLSLELWFHLSLDPRQNTVMIREPAFEVFAELNQDTTLPVKTTTLALPQRNVFIIALDRETWGQTRNSPYLRFVFPIDSNFVNTPSGGISLGDYARKNRIKFEGFNGNDAIIVYVRVPQQAL